MRYRIGLAVLGGAVLIACAAPSADVEWRYYGSDPYGTKYSPAAQIDAGNVDRLTVAWRWRSPDEELAETVRQRPGFFKVTPLMVDGVLYVSTAFSQAAAIDAASGRTLWVFDPQAYRLGRPANTGWQHRGVAYWENEAGAESRVVYATGTGELIALDAKTGAPIAGFGEQGRVDLQAGILESEEQHRYIGYNSAPIVVRDTVVLGCTVMDRPTTVEYVTCPVRGFDVRTGALKWAFHTVPREDDPASASWEEGAWRYSGAANAWTTFSADPALGYVYVPTGTPSNDYYGGHRKGDNRYAESLLCLNAETGELVWHFQAVHHGLWDYDFPAAPSLLDIRVDGTTIPAVAQVSKQGFTYVLHRATGEPVWPIEERPVPQSTVPGEQTSPTQPFPTRPPPFVKQGISEDDLIDFTPELRAAALAIVEDFKLGPIFTPPIVVGEGGKKTVVQVPGAAGGANWGGSGVDPETGLLYVQAANLPSPASVAQGKEGQADYLVEFAAMPVGPEGLPLLKPPYGTVTAIDLNQGDIAWQIPHGQGPTDHPAIRHLNLGPLGANSHSFLSSGGPLVTRTLLFVNQAQAQFPGFNLSATERFLRAFDKASGEVLWEHRMRLAPTGTPMTYVRNGRQYVVVAAGGAGEPAELVAFALPEEDNCAPAQGMEFVCGPVNGEDLVWLPDTDFMVVSGMAQEGESGGSGHLYLLDPVSREYKTWYPAASPQVRWDKTRFADCPGPLNPAHFSAHGLSVLPGDEGIHRLYVTSHGEREAVEVFEVTPGTDEPAIAWVGCVVVPDGNDINSVAALADGGFVTTRISGAQSSIAGNIIAGEITGFLYEWHPGGKIARVDGTDMSGPNGIVVSADEKFIYVGSWGRGRVVRFTRDADGGLVAHRAIDTGFRVDNLRWTDSGTLLATGHRLSDQVDCGQPLCFREWEVAELDAALTRVTTRVVKPPVPGFVGATVALRDRTGNGYWMGTFIGDRLVYVSAE